MRLLSLPLPNHLLHVSREEMELQVVSLLHELFIVSGGKVMTPNENTFNPDSTQLTPLDIMILYGFAFEVQTPTPQWFGTSDVSALQKALSRSRIFVQVTKHHQIRAIATSNTKE